MTVKLVTLDLNGTTVQVGEGMVDALRTAVENHVGGAIPEAQLRACYNQPKREAVRALLTAMGASPDTATVDKVFTEFTSQLVPAFAKVPPMVIDGVADAIRKLENSGMHVVVQTGYVREIADPLMAALGWLPGETFSGLVTSSDVPADRPAPYMVFRAMESTGVHSVDEVLVAGDMPDDLEAGTNSGARFVVGVLTGRFDAVELGRVRHTHLLAGVADIPALLAVD